MKVPEGARELEARFEFLLPTSESQGRVVVAAELLNLAWNCVVLYPAGYFSRGIKVEADLTLPDDWELACALPVQSREGGVTRFDRVGPDELVDRDYPRSKDGERSGCFQHAARLSCRPDQPLCCASQMVR